MNSRSLYNWVRQRQEILLLGLAALCLLLLLYFVSNRLLGAFLPRLPVVIIQIVLLRTGFKYVARCIVFPGSTALWRRSLENSYGDLLNKSISKLVAVCSTNTVPEVTALLVFVVESLKLQKTDSGVSPDQRLFLEALDALTMKLQSESLDVKPLCKKVQDLLSEDLIRKNENLLESIYKPGIPRILGSLDYLRAELKIRTKGSYFRVNKDKIQGILISNSSADKAVIIFCNPNAGYFETCYHQADWLDFYTKLGIDYCSWNYRGFGTSSGSPSLSNTFEDVQAVYDHLILLGYKKIGLHGRSIGGACAIHLADKLTKLGQPISFLITDTTFHSLGVASEYLAGKVAKFALWFAGEAGPTLTELWLGIDCPKLLTCDPNDEIIAEQASLKNGVIKSALSAKRTNTNAIGADSSYETDFQKVADSLTQLHEHTNPRIDGLREMTSLQDYNLDRLLSIVRAIFARSDFSPESLRIRHQTAKMWPLTESERLTWINLSDECNRLVSTVQNGAIEPHSMDDCLRELFKFAKEILSGNVYDPNHGQLLNLSCGHNGSFGSEEEQILISFVSNSLRR